MQGRAIALLLAGLTDERLGDCHDVAPHAELKRRTPELVCRQRLRFPEVRLPRTGEGTCGWRRTFDMPFQLDPARKAVAACERVLRVSESRDWPLLRQRPQECLGFLLQVLEAGRRSGRARCTTPPFATRPLVGRMKVSMLGYAQSSGGIVPFRGRDATCLAWGMLQQGHGSGKQIVVACRSVRRSDRRLRSVHTRQGSWRSDYSRDQPTGDRFCGLAHSSTLCL
jgi:hypothetical protein